MSTSADLGLPYIASSQAQPEVTHNEALNLFQALLNGATDRGINTPPGSPTSGDIYIVGTAPTGAWAGRANTVTIWTGTAWDFIPGETSAGTPITMGARQEGMRVWVNDENLMYIWSGSAWTVATSSVAVQEEGVTTSTSGTLNFVGSGITVTDIGGVATATVDADLNALASNATNGLLARTGAGTASARTITGTAAKVTVTNGDGVSGNPTLTIPDVVTLVTPTVTGLLTVSGGQIAFPATQVPSADANTLDDYEEGTWTPVLTFATPGNLSVAYSVQVGVYTKIGRHISVTFNIQTSSFTHTTASGGVQITGLPFMSSSAVGSRGSLEWSGINKASYTACVSTVGASQSMLGVTANGMGQSTSLVSAADMPTGGNIVLIGTIDYTA